MPTASIGPFAPAIASPDIQLDDRTALGLSGTAPIPPTGSYAGPSIMPGPPYGVLCSLLSDGCSTDPRTVGSPSSQQIHVPALPASGPSVPACSLCDVFTAVAADPEQPWWSAGGLTILQRQVIYQIAVASSYTLDYFTLTLKGLTQSPYLNVRNLEILAGELNGLLAGLGPIAGIITLFFNAGDAYLQYAAQQFAVSSAQCRTVHVAPSWPQAACLLSMIMAAVVD